MSGVPMTVVEMPHFIRQAGGLLSDDERLDVIKHLAIFAKNVKVDLTPEEKHEMRRLIPVLVQAYQERKAR